VRAWRARQSKPKKYKPDTETTSSTFPSPVSTLSRSSKAPTEVELEKIGEAMRIEDEKMKVKGGGSSDSGGDTSSDGDGDSFDESPPATPRRNFGEDDSPGISFFFFFWDCRKRMC
jgi:hypothetical protein